MYRCEVPEPRFRGTLYRCDVTMYWFNAANLRFIAAMDQGFAAKLWGKAAIRRVNAAMYRGIAARHRGEVVMYRFAGTLHRCNGARSTHDGERAVAVSQSHGRSGDGSDTSKGICCADAGVSWRRARKAAAC